MTELEQLETDVKFASLKKFLDRAGSLDVADRKLGGLSRAQARLFGEYYQSKLDLGKKIETRVKEAPLTVAKIRYGKIHPGHKIGRTKTGRIVIHNTRGRFVKVPRYFKQAIKGARARK